MESFYDDIDIIGADDNIDGHCVDTGPDPLATKFYVGTSTFLHNSASHLALQKAYTDLKKRYNDLAQRPRERAAKAYMRDVDIIDRSSEALMDDFQNHCLPSMAQAAGAEMPEMSSEQMKAQQGHISFLQGKLGQETSKLRRFEVENKSLKDKLVDIEGKYKTCLRDKDCLQQDFEIISQKVNIEKDIQCEKTNSNEQIKKEAAILRSEFVLVKQEIFENKKTITDLTRKLESSERQLKDRIIEEQSNQQRDNSELCRTRELLSEREHEVSELKKELSRLVTNINKQNSQSSIEKSKMDTSTGEVSTERQSILEDISIRQMNQNDGIIQKLQSETHQQAKLIQKLIEHATEKQGHISMEPQSRREVPGSSYVIIESPHVQIPTITGTEFSRHHASPFQREITGRDTKMDSSVPGYVSQRNVTLGGSQKSPVRNVLSEPTLMRSAHKSSATNDKMLDGHEILPNNADNCLNYQNGSVSFNIGSSGMAENTKMWNPHMTLTRKFSENSDYTKVSDSSSDSQYIFQNYQRPAASRTIPISTRQPIQSTAGEYDNFVIPNLTGSKRPDISSSGIGITDSNNESLFGISTRELFNDRYSTEHHEQMVPVQTEARHRQICPVCSQVFSDLPMEDFQTHVFECFDNEADPPETLRPEVCIERKCPMCESAFPENVVPQDEFEKHVQSHFGEDSVADRFEVIRP